MSDSFGTPVAPPMEEYPVQPPPQKDNKKIWIIVAIVVVVLCCCCLVIAGLVGYFTYNNSDFLNNMGVFLPPLLI